jgi:hypothetical protein
MSDKVKIQEIDDLLFAVVEYMSTPEKFDTKAKTKLLEKVIMTGATIDQHGIEIEYVPLSEQELYDAEAHGQRDKLAQGRATTSAIKGAGLLAVQQTIVARLGVVPKDSE